MEGKARVLGLLLSYVVLLKTLFPLRLGSTLLLTPQMQRLLSGGGSVLGELGLSAPGLEGAQGTRALKSELLDLAARSRGGLVVLGAEEQARFDQIVAELRELNALDRPASDPRLTGAWECRWTSEKEVSVILTVAQSLSLSLSLTLTRTCRKGPPALACPWNLS